LQQAAIAVGTVNLSPLNLDAGLISLSDNYQEFRFRRIRFRIWNQATADLGHTAWCGFTPTVTTAAPTFATSTSLPRFAIGNGQVGTPYPAVIAHSRELSVNAVRWFRRGTAYDDLIEVNGEIYYGWADNTAFNARPCFISLDYEIELRAQADTSITMKAPRSQEEKVLEVAAALNMMQQAPTPQSGVMVEEEEPQTGRSLERQRPVDRNVPAKAIRADAAADRRLYVRT